MADIKIQLNDFLGALKHITFGIANSNDDIYRNYFDTQTQYQVPMKAAFIYLKGLVKINEDRENNIDETIGIMEEALAVAPNFNMAKISIDALTAQKNAKVASSSTACPKRQQHLNNTHFQTCKNKNEVFFKNEKFKIRYNFEQQHING